MKDSVLGSCLCLDNRVVTFVLLPICGCVGRQNVVKKKWSQRAESGV